NFGAMDILCTDKTGTLTQDKIVLENHTDISGKTSERVLHSAWLNSHYQTGLKNLLDTAVLEGTDEESARSLASRWQKIDEIPFDSPAQFCPVSGCQFYQCTEYPLRQS
ncbi:hypothetical protein ACUOBA_48635, partial [Escherichia coli]